MVMVYNYLCRHNLHACLYLLSVATRPPDYHVSKMIMSFGNNAWRILTPDYAPVLSSIHCISQAHQVGFFSIYSMPFYVIQPTHFRYIFTMWCECVHTGYQLAIYSKDLASQLQYPRSLQLAVQIYSYLSLYSQGVPYMQLSFIWALKLNLIATACNHLHRMS